MLKYKQLWRGSVFCGPAECPSQPWQWPTLFMSTLPCRAVQCSARGDNNPHTRAQSFCIVQLNHLLNRGKLTSITNNINSFTAPRGILLLGGRGGWMLAFQQSLNKHPLQDLSMPGSAPHVALWFGKSPQPRTLLYVTSSLNKVKVELACCCGSAQGERTLRVEKQPSDKVYSYLKILNWRCQVGSRWPACHKFSCSPTVSFSFFAIRRPCIWLNTALKWVSGLLSWIFIRHLVCKYQRGWFLNSYGQCANESKPKQQNEGFFFSNSFKRLLEVRERKDSLN